MSDLIKVQIPFMGFYESIHNSNIDQAIEMGFNYDHETGEEKEVTAEVFDAIYAAVEWDPIHQEYAKKFVEAFGEEFDLDLTFDEMQSPQFYNYSTDRLFALAPREQIDKIRKEVEQMDDWADYIKERCSDGPGFWSFYPNDIKDEKWTRETLDECQYEIILRHWLRATANEDWEFYIMDDSEIYCWDTVQDAHEAVDRRMEYDKYVSEWKKDHNEGSPAEYDEWFNNERKEEQ